jgi:hypothetical protein
MNAWVYDARWTEVRPNNFVTEASTLADDRECPRCCAVLLLASETRCDREGEILYWVFRCRCGADLQVVND